jgi:NAD(P)-dependent dehydrogenase (short-subunit alcohol dehydrogenase family)
MTRTVVITGGTHGIGLALARERLRRGDVVVAVARNPEPGRRFVEEGGERAHFVAADLSTVAATRSVAARLAEHHPTIDALVLGAHGLQPRRTETAEGLEMTFALYYLSRYVLAHALADALAGGVVLNLSAPGITVGTVEWDDLQLTRRYSATRANLNAGRANDLLGVAFAERHPDVHHVGYNPGFVDTRPFSAMAQPWRALAEVAAAAAGAAPERAATALSALIDQPPAEAFSARKRRGSTNRTIDPGLRTFDPEQARRLDELTNSLVSGRA